MTSLRQIESNRRNALKSTGPTSESGKAIARGNALKHGLAGDGVADADEALVNERLETWRGGYRPETDEAQWLFEQVVVSSVRVDRCQREEGEVRTQLALRASLCWDDDRRLAAEELGRTLARKPALVVRKLRQTRQGCDWLVARWRALAEVLDRDGEWTDAQTALAFDLLGTADEFRAGKTPPARADVDRAIADLERLRAESLDDLDDLEREAAEQGIPVEPGRALVLLRRYEAASLRRYQWARKQLQAHRGAPAPIPAPPPPPPVAAAPAPEMTDRDWRAYERAIFQKAFARAGMTLPEPPGHAVPFVPSALDSVLPISMTLDPAQAAGRPATMH